MKLNKYVAIAVCALLVTTSPGVAFADDSVLTSLGSGLTSGGDEVDIHLIDEPKFTQVSQGGNYNLALSEAGEVYAWGDNSRKQLGIPGFGSVSTLIRKTVFPSPVTVNQIDTCGMTSLALDNSGGLWAWGRARLLGDNTPGDTNHRDAPALVTMPNGVSVKSFACSAGGMGSVVAIDTAGALWFWGSVLGGSGEVRIPTAVPIGPVSGAPYRQVTVGSGYAVALDDAGTAWSFGVNNLGQLGTGTTTASTSPIPVSMPAGTVFSDVTAGISTTIATPTLASSQLFGWGDNGVNHLLGLAADTAVKSVPTAIDLGTNQAPVDVAVGGEYVYVQLQGEQAAFWGKDTFGQSGSGAVPFTANAPTIVDNPGFIVVDAGAGSSISAVRSNLMLMNWGGGYNGQLGNGTYDSTPIPIYPTISTVQSLTIDGVEVAERVNIGGGDWRITIPAHAVGTVDIELLGYTLFGVPVTVPDAEQLVGTWTYYENSAPSVLSHPSDQSVLEYEPATFTVDPAGTPKPLVAWEKSLDGGANWVEIAQDEFATVDTNSPATIIVEPPLTHSGHLYRAVLTNSEGTATTNAAELTVTKVPTLADVSLEKAVSLDNGVTWSAPTDTPVVTSGGSAIQWGINIAPTESAPAEFGFESLAVCDTLPAPLQLSGEISATSLPANLEANIESIEYGTNAACSASDGWNSSWVAGSNSVRVIYDEIEFSDGDATEGPSATLVLPVVLDANLAPGDYSNIASAVLMPTGPARALALEISSNNSVIRIAEKEDPILPPVTPPVTPPVIPPVIPPVTQVVTTNTASTTGLASTGADAMTWWGSLAVLLIAGGGLLVLRKRDSAKAD